MNSDHMENKDIEIRDIVADIRAARFAIVLFTAFLTMAGALFGVLREKEYEAATILIPAGDEAKELGGLAGAASQYGGLASLAGISLPTSNRKSEALATLQSEQLTNRYILEEALLPVLEDSWIAGIRRGLGQAPARSLWRANQFFKRHVRSVGEDKLTGLITLRITWKDPKVAAKWANDLVKLTNEFLRARAISEAEKNIAYLNEQAARTSIIEARQAIYSLLKQALNSEMVARGREEYALKVIDPAFPPEKASSMGGLSLGCLGMVVGISMSFLIVFLRRILKSMW